MDDAIWDVTVFTKNRERLLDGDIAEAFFPAVLQQIQNDFKGPNHCTAGTSELKVN
jgi:hypothetical protein